MPKNTHFILHALLMRVTCKPGWRFSLVDDDEGLRLVIFVPCNDARATPIDEPLTLEQARAAIGTRVYYRSKHQAIMNAVLVEVQGVGDDPPGATVFAPGWMYGQRVELETLRARHDRPMAVNHYFPVPVATYNEKSWRRWVFECCRKVEDHELGEFFLVDGERPFAPLHGPGNDPYTIREVSTDEEARTDQQGHVAPNRPAPLLEEAPALGQAVGPAGSWDWAKDGKP